MQSKDFCTSKVFVNDGLSYVAIAEHCDQLTPNWAPEREISFALNKLLEALFDGQLCECHEGVFESQLSVEKLESQLRKAGFVYNKVLDGIVPDVLEMMT